MAYRGHGLEPDTVRAGRAAVRRVSIIGAREQVDHRLDHRITRDSNPLLRDALLQQVLLGNLGWCT